MSKSTTFLIVTPSFNQAEFIKKTIKSVLDQQGDFSVKYCIMDGGSTDETKKILNQLPKNIYWRSEKDQGQTDAINKGIDYFSKQKDFDPETAIFAYINSDDYYTPGAFAKVAQMFQNHPEAQWAVGDAIIVNSQDQEIQKYVRKYKQFWRRLYSSFILKVLNPIPQPSTFIRWQAVLQIGTFNTSLKYVMDYEYWLRLISSGNQPHFIRDPLSCFRIHGQSKGGSQFEKQFAEELEVVKRFEILPLAIFLHRLHNWAIVQVYHRVK